MLTGEKTEIMQDRQGKDLLLSLFLLDDMENARAYLLHFSSKKRPFGELFVSRTIKYEYSTCNSHKMHQMYFRSNVQLTLTLIFCR